MSLLRRPFHAALPSALTLLLAAAVALGAEVAAKPDAKGSPKSSSKTGAKASGPATASKPAKTSDAKKDAGSHGALNELPAYHAPDAYSVDFVIQADGQNITMSRSIDRGRIRSDISMGDDQKITMIEMGDKNQTTYTLMPDDKRAMKMSAATTAKFRGLDKTAGAPNDSSGPATLPPGTKIEYLGEEKLGDQAAKKFKMTSDQGDGLMWFDAASGAPLRMEGEYEGKKSVVEWKNYKVGPQSAALFEVPKGYDVMDMDEMMSKMGSGSGDLSQLVGSAGSMGGMGGAGAMAKGMVGGMAQSMGESMGSSFGSQLGATLGGPLGAMAGSYLGGKIGGYLGKQVTGN